MILSLVAIPKIKANDKPLHKQLGKAQAKGEPITLHPYGV